MCVWWLLQACQVETDPHLVNSYIIFLSQHAMDQDLQSLDNLALVRADIWLELEPHQAHACLKGCWDWLCVCCHSCTSTGAW